MSNALFIPQHLGFEECHVQGQGALDRKRTARRGSDEVLLNVHRLSAILRDGVARALAAELNTSSQRFQAPRVQCCCDALLLSSLLHRETLRATSCPIGQAPGWYLSYGCSRNHRSVYVIVRKGPQGRAIPRPFFRYPQAAMRTPSPRRRNAHDTHASQEFGKTFRGHRARHLRPGDATDVDEEPDRDVCVPAIVNLRSKMCVRKNK